MAKTLTFTLTGLLGPAGSTGPLLPFAGIRICPWNDTSSHLNGYTAVKVKATARLQGLGTLVLRTYEFNLGTGASFNPSALRDTDRSNPLDTLTILDPTIPANLSQGVILHEAVGSIIPVQSPTFRCPQDNQNTREWLVTIENTEFANLRYTIDLEITPTCSKD